MITLHGRYNNCYGVVISSREACNAIASHSFWNGAKTVRSRICLLKCGEFPDRFRNHLLKKVSDQAKDRRARCFANSPVTFSQIYSWWTSDFLLKVGRAGKLPVPYAEEYLKTLRTKRTHVRAKNFLTKIPINLACSLNYIPRRFSLSPLRPILWFYYSLQIWFTLFAIFSIVKVETSRW